METVKELIDRVILLEDEIDVREKHTQVMEKVYNEYDLNIKQAIYQAVDYKELLERYGVTVSYSNFYRYEQDPKKIELNFLAHGNAFRSQLLLEYEENKGFVCMQERMADYITVHNESTWEHIQSAHLQYHNMVVRIIEGLPMLASRLDKVCKETKPIVYPAREGGNPEFAGCSYEELKREKEVLEIKMGWIKLNLKVGSKVTWDGRAMVVKSITDKFITFVDDRCYRPVKFKWTERPEGIEVVA